MGGAEDALVLHVDRPGAGDRGAERVPAADQVQNPLLLRLQGRRDGQVAFRSPIEQVWDFIGGTLRMIWRRTRVATLSDYISFIAKKKLKKDPMAWPEFATTEDCVSKSRYGFGPPYP